MENKETKYVTGGGVGFLGLLQIVFIVLKLIGKIDWSWPKVLIPLWIELGIVGVFIIVIAVLYGVFKDD